MNNRDREYQFRAFTLWVFVTNKCNRSCSYCKQGTPIEFNDHMSREDLRYILDECIIAHEQKIVDRFNILLSGGEPFLEFDMFSEIVEYYKKMYPHILNFQITTNGTIVNGKITEWLQYNCKRIAVSIDSLRYSKPLNNISSSALQINNIELLSKAGVEVSGLTVFHSQTLDEMMELTEYVVKNLFAWRILLCKPIIHSKEQILSIAKPVLKYLYNHDHHRRFDFDGWSLWNEARGGKGGRSTCICGRGLLSVTPDLETHPNNEAPFIKLGKFTHDIQSLIDHPDNIYFKNDWRPPICNGCDLRRDCDGGCRLCHKDPTMLKEKCDAIRELLEYVKELGPYYKKPQ